MYRKTALSNGMRVITHSMAKRDSVSLGLLIGAGGRFEDDRIKGAAHFLEHILFKGSKKYSCDQIKQSVEGVGGSLNAFTSEDKTCYYAKIPARYLANAFDVLADMVAYPLITSKDVNKERTVIMEEIKMYHDLPHYYVLELLDCLMWPGHPLGKSLAGSLESISVMSARDLKGFCKDHYAPNHIVLSVCGGLEHQKVVRLAREKFSGLPGTPQKDFVKADNSQNAPRIKFEKRDIEQMHLALGFLGLTETHPDRYILGLLHVILGANMSSRLFNQIREKRGLAYSISTSMKFYADTGMFMVRAGVDNNKVVEAVELIMKELSKIKRSRVSNDELKRAQDYFIGQTVLGLEDTLEHMLWLGDSVMTFGRPRTLKDVISKIERVTLADIQRVAKDIFDEKRFNLAIVGPLQDAQEKKLRKVMKVED